MEVIKNKGLGLEVRVYGEGGSRYRKKTIVSLKNNILSLTNNKIFIMIVTKISQINNLVYIYYL